MSDVDPILALADDHYTMGNCRVIAYNRTKRELFGDNILNSLYDACLASRPSHQFGILPNSMCGMLDLSRDAMIAYWSTRNIILLTLDKSTPLRGKSHSPFCDYPTIQDGSIIAGFSFITFFQGAAANPPGHPQPIGERAAMGAYACFRPWWGTVEIERLGMLGLAWYFQTYSLSAIHGQRFSHNTATAKFMARYGSREMGIIPKFLADRKGGKADGDVILSDCGVSTLLRSDDEAYCRKYLRSLIP